ncbi:YdcF family protein [Desulfurispirillum indicum]|uniref:YdcF family protein n=1 Tax=Desulfurispirillum indicum TaxID=936456 RepID=UPI003CCCCC9F
MEKFRTLVVLLGNENDEAGELSETAILRAQAAAEYVKAHADCLVLPTGAFGDHFNTSATPHGKLLALYLLGQGVSPDRILPSTKSSNTLEDAFGVLRALTSLAGIERVHIITSAFHMPRTRFIFGRVLQDYELSYQEACDPTDSAKRVRLQAHEKKALEKIRREWVDVANFDLGNFPTASYEGLGYELRHYDNISYLAIAGGIYPGCARCLHCRLVSDRQPGCRLGSLAGKPSESRHLIEDRHDSGERTEPCARAESWLYTQ